MSRTMQMTIFLSVVILVLVGSHVYFYFRLIRAVALPSPWRQIATYTLIVLGASVPMTFVVSRTLDHAIAKTVLFVPYCWIGMMLLLGFWLLSSEILRVMFWFGMKMTGSGDWLRTAGHKILVHRIFALGVVGIAFVLGLMAVWQASTEPKIKALEIEIKKLPEAMDGFKIVQLTDLHLGPTLNRAFAEKVTEKTNREKPDLVVLTGDLVDGSVDRLMPALEPFRRIEASHGVFLITGNHEFYSGVDQWIPAFEKLGIRVLANQGVRIERNEEAFYLAGVHDPQGVRFGPGYAPDLERALSDRDPMQAVILLAHQARIIGEAEKQSVDLVLSGHNHGGQIWPWMYLVGLQQPYVSGLHRHGRAQIYVSEGTGFWGPPMRLGTRSEITAITLRADGTRQ